MRVRRADGSVITYEVVGEPDGAPVLFCHGLADSRLSARMLAPQARQLGLRLVAPDRPGIGATGPRRLDRVAGWTADAALVLDAAGAGPAAVLGISGGGPYAAACAALLPARVRRLVLIAPLGDPGWPTLGMAAGERASLQLARRAPAFSGWAMGRLAALARHSPGLFFRLSTSEMPGSDRRLLEEPPLRADFLANYIEAFRQGSGGVAQDLRLLTRPWGFGLESIMVPVTVHHGDADTTVPLRHAELYAAAIPGAQLRTYPGDGHFSIMRRSGDMLTALAG
jgi:pimeloyl-ACP methyl ester carboxylesterase